MEEDFVNLTRCITRDCMTRDTSTIVNCKQTSRRRRFHPSLYFRGIGETNCRKIILRVPLFPPCRFRGSPPREDTRAHVREKGTRRGSCVLPISTFLEEVGEGRYSKKLRYSVKSTGRKLGRVRIDRSSNEPLLTSFEARSFPYLNFRVAKRGGGEKEVEKNLPEPWASASIRWPAGFCCSATDNCQRSVRMIC